MRQVALDTETTGLSPEQGHRVIEIGCVELINRKLTGNNFHVYLQPDREVDAGAVRVHGITNEFLIDKPRFAEVAKDFLEYISDADLIIHNAAFDLRFLNHEMNLWKQGLAKLDDTRTIIDTLLLARKMHPGQKNSLDALCKRYMVDDSKRELHGALLDAELLVKVYLAMTGGQTSMSFDGMLSDTEQMLDRVLQVERLSIDTTKLLVIQPTEEELAEHLAIAARLGQEQD